MRTILIATLATLATLATVATSGCATSGGTEGSAGGEEDTTVSVAFLGSGGSAVSPVIRVAAGPVRLRHTVPSTARLRATVLEGLDEGNRHLRYEWDGDGSYTVAVSGRYRHSVLGSMVGGGAQRLRSTLTYVEAR